MERIQVCGLLQQLLEEETDNKLGHLSDEMVLVEEFALDSVDYVSLIMRIEESFHIRLSNSDLNSVATVGSLIDLVSAKISEQTARRVA